MVTAGVIFVMVELAVTAGHPEGVAVTVYVPGVVVLMEEVVAPLDQAYVNGPVPTALAVSVTKLPAQTVADGLAATVTLWPHTETQLTVKLKPVPTTDPSETNCTVKG